MGDCIQNGCTVIVQRGTYLKSCRIYTDRSYKFGKQGGQFTLNFDGAIGALFGSSFKMVRVKNKIYKLERLKEFQSSIHLGLESGEDNRELQDDGKSQKLTKEDIDELVDSGATGQQVIQKLAENSSTFRLKTKYAQQKYVSKKQQKYEEIVLLHKPTIHLLTDMLYRQDPLKISNLRIDSLAQLLCLANVQPNGRFCVFEAGTQGLVTAAMLHSVGCSGHIVHVFHGNQPQRDMVDSMNFVNELETLTFINIDNLPDSSCRDNNNQVTSSYESTNPSVTVEVNTDSFNQDNSTEMCKTTEIVNSVESNVIMDKIECAAPLRKPKKYVRTRQEDTNLSSSLLASGVHGLIIACRQYPSSVALALLPFLISGYPFAVFSPYKEPLMELYGDIKKVGGINLKLTETWLREYQVLPERTHPKISMSGGGGYLLYGTMVDNT